MTPTPRLVLACALAASALAARPAAALTGREVIQTANEKNGFSTWRDRVVDSTMESYVKSLERTREATISEQTDPRGEHRTFMEFTSPNDVTGTLFLHLSPRGATDQQWLWSPVSRRARRLADASRDENFMGTDLSYRDIELMVRIQQWNDAEASATLIGEEPVDGRPAHVVELVPANREFPYTKYRLWFDTADALLWRVDVYEGDAVQKRVTLGRYEPIGPYQTAMEWQVANLPADTRTSFRMRDVRYDEGVSDAVFSVSNLDKG
jgi:hypothetical protein